MTRVLQIVAGSYEHKIFGFDCLAETDDDSMSLALTPVFAYAPHAGCVKSVAMSGNGQLLASGSTDEHIKLYNLKTRRELGDLIQHDGAITTLDFFGKTHLMSGAADGMLAIWRTKDWECLKVMRGHKGEVHDVAIHPTGRLALSVGKDKSLRLWNLLKGRSAYIKNIHIEGTKVVWSHTGVNYAVAADKQFMVYNLESGKQMVEVKSPSGYANDISFVGDDMIVSGFDDGTARVYGVETGKQVHVIQAHEKRVKALQVVPSPLANDTYLLVTACTDGSLRVWDLAMVDKETETTQAMTDSIAEIETNSRLTCVDAVSIMSALAPETESEKTIHQELDQLQDEESSEEEDEVDSDEDEDDGDDDEDDEDDVGEWVTVGSDMPSEEGSGADSDQEEAPAPAKGKKRPASAPAPAAPAQSKKQKGGAKPAPASAPKGKQTPKGRPQNTKAAKAQPQSKQKPSAGKNSKKGRR